MRNFFPTGGTDSRLVDFFFGHVRGLCFSQFLLPRGDIHHTVEIDRVLLVPLVDVANPKVKRHPAQTMETEEAGTKLGGNHVPLGHGFETLDAVEGNAEYHLLKGRGETKDVRPLFEILKPEALGHEEQKAIRRAGKARMASDVAGKAREETGLTKLPFFLLPELRNRNLGTLLPRSPQKPHKEQDTNNEEITKKIHDVPLFSEEALELPQVAQLVAVQELQLELEEELLER